MICCEKSRHDTVCFSDEEAATKRIGEVVMNDREFFCQRHRAVPDVREALDLVWTLANEMAACTTMIDSGEVRLDPPSAPLPSEALRVFHANYEALG